MERELHGATPPRERLLEREVAVAHAPQVTLLLSPYFSFTPAASSVLSGEKATAVVISKLPLRVCRVQSEVLHTFGPLGEPAEVAK